jgi:hypothetical protein
MAFTIVGDAALVSGNCSDSRKAAVFTGGNTDDSYSTNALAVECCATDTVGTITAWINTGDITSTGAIIEFNDANVVEFLDFKVVAGKVSAAMTDATVARWATATTNVVLTAHKWHHVALVQDGDFPKIYVDGVKQAQTDSVTTALTEWCGLLDGVDVGFIGASSIGGAGAIGEEFVGGISDVKVYSTALTAAQILDDYKGTHLATGCRAWYKMDDLLDSATGAGTYSLTANSDVYMTPTYNEFISRVRKFGAVVADVAGFNENMGRMSVLFINAA